MRRTVAEESLLPETEQTGLPGLRTWTSVYIVVIIHFALWVIFLAVLSSLFL